MPQLLTKSPRLPRTTSLATSTFPRGTALLAVISLLAFFAGGPAFSAILWVGDSAACTGPNTHTSVNSALGAAIAGGDDTVRLTQTLSYTNGDIADLVDWNPAAVGRLTLEGGYADCFSAKTGRTTITGLNGDVITIRTAGAPVSDVTLRSLRLTGSSTVGVRAQGGADVSIEDTEISHNEGGGVRAETGADVSLDGETVLLLNGEDDTAPLEGGGLWCSFGSSVVSAAFLDRNSAFHGGGYYVDDGCILELLPGAAVWGFGAFPAQRVSWHGGGAYVDDGGILVATGASFRVEFRFLSADSGAGIYVQGNGLAALTNTWIDSSSARIGGSGISVAGSGSAGPPQLTMDRASACQWPPFSCSEMERLFSSGDGRGVAISLNNARALIRRVLFDRNDSSIVIPGTTSLIELTNGSWLEIDSAAFMRNTTNTAFFLDDGSQLDAAHLTVTGNETEAGDDVWAVIQQGGSSTDTRNGLFTDINGINSTGVSTVAGNCNLTETSNGFGAGNFFVGVPTLTAAHDFRQQPDSLGVDMCPEDGFLFTTDRDIAWQLRPFDVPSNPNGSPGVLGQIYDAGAAEVMVTIPSVIFQDGFESGNTSAWSSTSP